MATLEVTSTAHTRVVLSVSELQWPLNMYDKFICTFTQSGKTIFTQDYSFTSAYLAFDIIFDNPDYLGNNWFAPMTTYSASVTCYINGDPYRLGPVTFTTDSISPPTGSIAPAVYPTVKNQGAAGNCVAMTLASAMEIIKAQETGISEHYSVSYIYGSDNGTDEWMAFREAVELCQAHGSPRWELVTSTFPDSNYKADSVALFQSACPLAKSTAKKQAFTGYQNIDFYDCAAVANAIRTYGGFMFCFRIPNNFNFIPSTGIVPQPANGYRGDNHAMLLIGLTTINGKPHWIAQNSWGTGWGKGGICYVPYDWGCGVQSPSNSNDYCGWTLDCYALWNTAISAQNPPVPSGLTGKQNGTALTATLSWVAPGTGTSTLLYARKRGTTDWWPKPSYGSLFDGATAQLSFDTDKTVYEVMAIAVRDYLLSPQTEPIIISTNALALWSWRLSNGKASPVQTQTAHKAIKEHGPTTDFSHLVWDDLVAKINEVVMASGHLWDNTSGYGTYSETLLSGPGRAMTAKRFNAARYNVGRIYQTGIAEVHTGDPMLGSYFITLAAKLNEWIGTIGKGG